MSEPITHYKSTTKDLPKIEGKPKPEENMIWSCYIIDGKMRARLHPPGNINISYWDSELVSPENFCAVVDYFRGKHE